MMAYCSLHEGWHETLKQLGVFGPSWTDVDAPPRAAVMFYNKGGEFPLSGAEELLRGLLASGKVSAVGEIDEMPGPIPLNMWEYGEVRWDENLIWYNKRHIATEVSINRRQLETKLSQFKKPMTTAANQKRCRNWLVSIMADSPLERTGKKDSFWEKAEEKFRISRNSFNNAWDEAIQEANAVGWSKAGRPKKQNA